ncbi:MAG: hypothetical protein PHF84_12805 [bacterium]|nr:hypothetical protein [bacterium]
MDIICPCDYRDPDLDEFGSCLYVSDMILNGGMELKAIPDRKGTGVKNPVLRTADVSIPSLPLPVWRCRVCGYLCAREHPPETCPVCKAQKDRFEKFM